MGSVKNITHVALQGRPHSKEYVTEFTISYGISDLEFADYKEPGGNVMVSTNDFGINWKLKITHNIINKLTSLINHLNGLRTIFIFVFIILNAFLNL